MPGLYIHIPFCVKKCGYCDFVSVCADDDVKHKYISALLRESEEFSGEEIDSVFIGGGTPSVLSVSNISKILDGIRKNFKISPDAEFTTEVNPDSVTDEKIRAFISGGVNRISMGVQSFSDTELSALGRVHSADTAKRAIEIIGKHTPNFNLDIMTAIPNQTKESLFNTLKTAVSYSPTHISAYSLIIEENTPFYEKYGDGTGLVGEDEDREMYRMTGELLGKSGYGRYEISNYAKSGYECRHNLKYWNCDEYIGIGAAAHSYVNNIRYSNASDIKKYISADFEREKAILSESDKISEFMIMGLRKTVGISVLEFKRRFGKDIDNVFGKTIKKYTDAGFMEIKDGHLCFTEKGIDVSNSILCEFV